MARQANILCYLCVAFIRALIYYYRLQKRSTYHILVAYALVLIFIGPMGIQAWHDWSEAHDQVEHCEREAGQSHLHDHHYAKELCFYCSFTFSHLSENSLSQLDGTKYRSTSSLRVNVVTFPFRHTLITHPGRAPPTLV